MIISQEHADFREETRALLNERIVDLIDPCEREGSFPHEAVLILARKGYFGIPFSKEYGGLGKDALSYAIAVEEISRLWGSLGITVAAHTSLGCSPLYYFGTEEQKRRWLPHLLSGEYFGAFGLTEPNAGSDAGGTQTTARAVDAGWCLDGGKIFITTASYSGLITATARTGKNSISAFLIERGTQGYSVGKKEDKLGLRSSDTAVLIFDNCVIPRENLLGKEGEGFKIFMKTLDGGRISIAAMALGIAQGALDEILREISSDPRLSTDIFSHQTAKGGLADAATRIAAARHLVYHAAQMKDRGLPHIVEGSMAKLFAAETAMHITSWAIELAGPAGVTRCHALQRGFRDAKLTEIGEGTSQIQRLVIARELVRQAISTATHQ